MFLVTSSSCSNEDWYDAPDIAVIEITPGLLDLLHRAMEWIREGKHRIGNDLFEIKIRNVFASWYRIVRDNNRDDEETQTPFYDFVCDGLDYCFAANGPADDATGVEEASTEMHSVVIMASEVPAIYFSALTRWGDTRLFSSTVPIEELFAKQDTAWVDWKQPYNKEGESCTS